MIRAFVAFAGLAPSLCALAQWETSQGGNGRRDGFVDTTGPARMRAGWAIDLHTQDPLQPIVGDGKVFFAHSPDWQSSNGATVSAADLDTGAVLWTTTVPLGRGLHPTPKAYRDGVVYVMPTGWFLMDEFLYALDAGTGALLWQSQEPGMTHFYTSPLFLPDGDLLMNGRYVTNIGWKLMRIDHRDGSVVWIRPATDGSNPEVAGGALFQDRFYIVRDYGGRTTVARIDVDTGARLYSSPLQGTPGQTAAHENITIDRNGTILWHFGDEFHGGSVLIAFRDTGTSLVEIWRSPIGDSWASNIGVGPDGSIYCVSQTDELLRLDPLTGAARARTAPFPFDVTTTRLAIDREGHVFGLFRGQGATVALLRAFQPNLRSLWIEELGVAPTEGPTLAQDGTLIVSTNAQVVRTFRPLRVAPHCLEPATVRARNGSGVNPPCFLSTDEPRLGRPWRVSVDTSVHPAPSLFGVAFHLGSSSGTFLRGGELLVDPDSTELTSLVRPVTAPLETLSIDLPERPELCGLRVYGQAFLVGAGRTLLCNALDLTLGQ